MATISLSPTAVDQEDLRAQLQDILATKDAWSGYLTTQTGQTLIDYAATVGAFAHAKSMRYAQDAFAETAVSARALYSIADMQGVRIARKGAASITCSITYAPTLVGSPATATLLRFTQFQAAGTYWYTKDAVVVASGATTTFTLYQGYVVDQTMVGLGTDYVTFLSPEKGFVVENESVYVVMNGTDITRAVDGLWNYGGVDAFLDKTTPEGRLRILFGNASFGAKPQPTDNLRIVYAVTSGSDANALTTQNALVTVVTGTPHGVKLQALTNPAGGSNEPDATLYKTVGAYNFGSFGAAVTKTQCVAAALSYPGIVDVRMSAQREIDPGNSALMNTVKVVGLTASPWTTTQKNAFLTSLQNKSMYALRYYWVDPVSVAVDVTFTLHCHNWASLTQCTSDATAAVQSLFAPKKGLLGRDLPLSDLYDAIKNSNSGIEYLDLVSPTAAQLVSGAPLPMPSITQLPESSVTQLPSMSEPTVEFTAGSSPPFATGTYAFAVTAVTAAGETAAIKFTTITLDSTQSNRTSCMVMWSAYPGALSYKVYASTPGQPAGYLGEADAADLFLIRTNDVFSINTSLPAPVTTTIPTLPVSSQLSALSYSYAVTGVTALGETAAVSFGSTVITTANTTVNHLTWPAMSGILTYRVYGRSGPDYGLIATTKNTVYDDWGQNVPDLDFRPPVATTYPAAYLTLAGVNADARFSTRA